jgi:hypothetical protein
VAEQDLMYRMDVRLRVLRRWLRGGLPIRVVERLRGARASTAAFGGVIEPLLNGDGYPWCSPNVWERIVSTYGDRTGPTVFEYGSGISSLWHIRRLRQMGGGTYVAVEADATWLWAVTMVVVRDLMATSDQSTSMEVEPVGAGSDLDMRIASGDVRAHFKLRRDPQSYIGGLDQSVDLVVVDGDHRNECVERVCETSYLRSGGAVALHDAGRGRPDWWEGRLRGASDYSNAASALLLRGGVFVDGQGMDRWPGCGRRSARPASYLCPSELCIAIREGW